MTEAGSERGLVSLQNPWSGVSLYLREEVEGENRIKLIPETHCPKAALLAFAYLK